MAPMTPKAKKRPQRDGAALTNYLVHKLESQIKGLVNSEAFFFYREGCMSTACTVKLRNDYESQISRKRSPQ
jgi:hypothetical protein